MRWNFQTKLTLREIELAYVICLQKTGVTWAMLVHSCSVIVRMKVFYAFLMSARLGDLTRMVFMKDFPQTPSVIRIFLVRDVDAVLQ